MLENLTPEVIAQMSPEARWGLALFLLYLIYKEGKPAWQTFSATVSSVISEVRSWMAKEEKQDAETVRRLDEAQEKRAILRRRIEALEAKVFSAPAAEPVTEGND